MDLLAFVLVWIGSIAAAIAVGSRLQWWLIWRLLLFVPLVGEIALFGFFGNSGKNIVPHMLADPYKWTWFGIFFVYGVILYGPSAIALGGLGWLIVKARALPLKVSNSSFVLLGTLAGGVIGALFQIAYRILADLGLHNVGAVWTWGFASIFGGAAGGFIVGHYGTKEHPIRSAS